jgi:hypothetical protein
MKINDETRFPHPVLDPDNGDYLSGEFSISLSAVEVPDRAEVALDYAVTLTEPALRDAVANDRAGVGIFVTCRDTYFNQIVSFGLDPSRFAFEPGALVGRVLVRPIIWARRPITGFALANCHAEFGTGSVDFRAGDVLGLGDEIILNIGHEKLAQIETIFSLARSDDLEPNTLSVDLEDEKVKILAAANIYDTVNTLRGLGHGRPIILNSVYLPAVMQVLESLKGGGAGFESRRWFRVFNAKCDHLGISLENPDLWLDAQRLLEAPFAEIESKKEALGQ